MDGRYTCLEVVHNLACNMLHACSDLISIVILFSLGFASTQRLRGPSNITRAVNETDVFIPCPFEFSPTPSLWRINGTDYTSSMLPSIFSLSPGGLFINTVVSCLDQTSFQCIDTSGDGLVGQGSSVGVLTVTPQGTCKGIQLSYYSYSSLVYKSHRESHCA